MSEDQKETRQRALALLARREHSERELRQKLTARGFAGETVDRVVAQLQAEGLQSDTRYTESLVYHRSSQGCGPLRITRELKAKGISEEVIQAFIDAADPQWQARLAEVHAHKFGDTAPRDYKEQARQTRFLQYRGFGSEQISHLFNRLKRHDD